MTLVTFFIFKVFSVSKAEHASSTSPTKLHVMGGGGEGQQASILFSIAKQAVEFPQ